jgi:hypothetical protein
VEVEVEVEVEPVEGAALELRAVPLSWGEVAGGLAWALV